MKYLHKFEELSDFTEEYMGEAYKEPWVSLTKENDKVDYNKLLGGWFRVPKYESDFREQYLTDEEREVFSRFFDTFKVDGFDPAASRTGTTFNVKVSPEVTVYRVGGIVDDFDPEDNRMWHEKDTNFKNVKSVFAREFKSYFDSPVAYVFLVAFLVLIGFLTFGVAMFYERRQAVLTPFFLWHPWVYLLLVPAATMGLWAEERRNGTIELLLTLPITLGEALIGKFLAAWAFIGIALALTFPVPATAAWLGSPDCGAVFCGYVGSLMLAGACTAIAVANWGVPASVVNAVASCSLMRHFDALCRGVVDLADIGYYVGVIVFMLAAAQVVTDSRKAS